MAFPKALECPITYEMMKKAVIAPDGYTYDLDNITECLRINGKSPFTNMLMQIKDLVPNRAIQDQIDEYNSKSASGGAAALAPATIIGFKNAPFTVNAIKHPGPGGSWYLDVETKIAEYGPKQPIFVVINLDVSGSMETKACNIIENGGKEITRIDLVIYAAMAIINMLSENDTLCILKFSDISEMVVKPILMTPDNKIKVIDRIKTIHAGGSTNIMSAIQHINEIVTKPEYNGMNIITALLTDGEPTIRPPRVNENEIFSKFAHPDTFSTFGFGNSLDSNLLSSLSKNGGGTYGFIPDDSVLISVMMNWLITALSTGSKSHDIKITYANGTTSTHQTGLIQFGQEKNLTIVAQSEPVSIHINENIIQPTVGELNEFIMVRFSIMNTINACIANDGRGEFYTLHNKYKNTTDPKVKELIRDINPTSGKDQGQVAMALQYWNTWGKHYIIAYKIAMENQYCMNFKDPGMQIYGGKLFHELLDLAETNIAKMKPIVGTGRTSYTGGGGASGVGAPVPSGTNQLYNAAGGCWAPGTKILMSDNTSMAIENILPGMMVWTPYGNARVEYMLKMGSKIQPQVMCKVNNLVLTPWHPIMCIDQWIHPVSIEPMVNYNMPNVYNLILDKGHIVSADDMLTITLGHGSDNPFLDHAYFKSKQKILDDMKNLPGFDEGLPVFSNLKTKNDPVTGLIIGWYND
jgi:Mg-chelatase subunit ChlD